MKKFLVIRLLFTITCKKANENSQGEDFSNNVNKVANTIVDDSQKLEFFSKTPSPIQSQYTHFPTGSVSPKGWILDIMKNDLENGMVGALQDLYPGIKSDDLYNSARRGGMEDIPEMGDLVLTGAEWEESIMWWNAETIGNWWDGYIRHAFLTKNKRAISQSKKIVENLLSSQDKDGYIGIYKPNLRYRHEGSNGELWAQTTAFRAMLAYYEFTQDEKVLDAVEKAMQVTMKKYGEKARNPFYLKNAFGGVTHGLMLTDVCETLYRITGNSAYQEYATFLYKAFSTYSINRSFNDLRFPYLIEKDSLFEGHGVHTYEHIRTMVNAYYNTGYPELKEAYDNMLFKLQQCILPSGAGHGNEWIAKLKANPDKTSSEYCTMLELRNSYGSLIQKTGDLSFADAAEKLTYNAMMGFRNKNGTALTYGKGDNCYVLDGHHHEGNEKRKDPRYKYSPTHSEPAVCCVPNYGRNYTYFLDQMWMKKEDGIAAIMFGPSELSTEINGVQVKITEETNYPLSDEMTFHFELEKPTEFTFFFRNPKWSKSIVSSIETKSADGLESITKTWKTGDKLTIKFIQEAKTTLTSNNEYFIQRGPIVYAFEILHQNKVIKNYELENFEDYYCYPTDETYKNLAIKDQPQIRFNSNNEVKSFYDNDVHLEVEFETKESQKMKNYKLIPMGKTVLRRVTFPLKK